LKFQTNNISFNHKYHYSGQKIIEGFLLNHEFIKILTRATNEYLEMWKEFVNVYPIVTKLKKRLNSLLEATSKVHKTYKSLQKHKNKYSALFYYFYLNMVSKNEEKIKEI
jgi:acyl carrier protein phosphodiesterase